MSKNKLPREMVIAGRTYEIIDFLKKGEKCVDDEIMISRAKEIGANVTEDHGNYILKNQTDIPEELRDEVVFVFLDWPYGNNGDKIHFLVWREAQGEWVVDWLLKECSNWGKKDRLVKLKNGESSLPHWKWS